MNSNYTHRRRALVGLIILRYIGTLYNKEPYTNTYIQYRISPYTMTIHIYIYTIRNLTHKKGVRWLIFPRVQSGDSNLETRSLSSMNLPPRSRCRCSGDAHRCCGAAASSRDAPDERSARESAERAARAHTQPSTDARFDIRRLGGGGTPHPTPHPTPTPKRRSRRAGRCGGRRHRSHKPPSQNGARLDPPNGRQSAGSRCGARLDPPNGRQSAGSRCEIIESISFKPEHRLGVGGWVGGGGLRGGVMPRARAPALERLGGNIHCV